MSKGITMDDFGAIKEALQKTDRTYASINKYVKDHADDSRYSVHILSQTTDRDSGILRYKRIRIRYHMEDGVPIIE